MIKKYLIVITALLLLSGLSASAEKLHLTFDHFYDGQAVIDAIHAMNKAYPGLTELQVLGKSEEGRDIWEMTINNPKTGKDTDKPGIYVDGTIHGNEIQATEVCLYLAWYLLDSYDSNPMIKELVDSRAFYIIPVVNVDNRWRFFTDPGGYNIGRTGMVPYDDDRDGLVDEDPDDDIDGDGEILEMRVRDPYGNWKSDPDDPRVMVRVKDGERGEWTLLGDEGIDNDGDGRINEDGPGYLDMNRNWGFKWQPQYVQSGAGDFPMSGKVPHAISQFVLTKPNICFDYAFHNSGGLWVRGPGSKLAGMYPPSDIKVYDYLGDEGEKIMPGYKYIIGSKDMYTTHGDFDEWMFSGLGIYGFVGELFMGEQEQYRTTKKAGEEKKMEWYEDTPEVEKHKFDDRVNQGTMFSDWKDFDHPQLGKIQIGGWKKFTSRIPPRFMLPEMVHRAASMVIFTARETPSVKLELIDVTDMGDGLKRVRVRAYNSSAMPSLSAQALRRDIYRKDIFSIKGSSLEVVSGGIISDLFRDRVQPVRYRPEMIFSSVPSFGTREIQWIVKGSGTATVTYNALKAADGKLEIKI